MAQSDFDSSGAVDCGSDCGHILTYLSESILIEGEKPTFNLSLNSYDLDIRHVGPI